MDTITQLFNAVMADFETQGVAVGWLNASGPGALTKAVGARALEPERAPPNIVWVPTAETYEGPTKTKYGGDVQRALLDSERTVDVHCWGDSLEAAERLRTLLVWALKQQAGGSVRWSGAKWFTQEEAQWLTRGEMLVVTVGLMMPVLDFPATTVVVQAVAVDPTGATAGDGVLQVGES